MSGDPKVRAAKLLVVVGAGALGIGAIQWLLRPPVSQPVTITARPVPVPREPPKPACTTADFEVSKLRFETSYGYVKARGLITNNYALSAGLEVKWTGYFADGSVAFSTKLWPASTVNIQAGKAYPFEITNRTAPGVSRYEVEPASVYFW